MAIDVSKLEVSVIEGERWRRTLSIKVPSEELRAERSAAVRQLSSKVKLPGFRAGKIPLEVIEQRFGQALEEELLDRVIGEAYRGALENEELRPISEGEVADVDYGPDSDLAFQISFDVAPKVELARVGGFRVTRTVVDVPEAEVDSVLTRMREQEGTWVPVEEGRPEAGDLVSVRILRSEEEDSEGRPYEFVLGRDEAIPDVESAIETLEVGGSGEFAVKFPEDLQNEERRGKEEILSIALEGRKRLDLPELTDDFASSVGAFETLEELRSRIRDDLEREAEREAEAELRGKLMEEIFGANPFDLPESMVDRYVRSALGDPDDLPIEQFEEAKNHLRSRAVHAVKRHLVIDHVGEREGLAATTEEVDEKIEEIADRTDSAVHEVYARLQKAGQLESLEREITERKVFDYLKAQSEVSDAKGR